MIGPESGPQEPPSPSPNAGKQGFREVLNYRPTTCGAT